MTKRSVFIDGNWTIADLKHDMYYGSGKSRIFIHFIPSAAEGQDALSYQMNGPYPVVIVVSGYKALAKECIERYGLSSVLKRVPTRGRKIILRAAEELIEEGKVD